MGFPEASRGPVDILYGWSASDLSNDNEFITFGGDSGFNALMTVRLSMTITPMLLHNLFMRCAVNNNVSDGANLQLVTAVDPWTVPINVNQVIVVDQATGVFIDNVNTDLILVQQTYSAQYHEGSVGATCTWRPGGIYDLQ